MRLARAAVALGVTLLTLTAGAPLQAGTPPAATIVITDDPPGNVTLADNVRDSAVGNIDGDPDAEVLGTVEWPAVSGVQVEGWDATASGEWRHLAAAPLRRPATSAELTTHARTDVDGLVNLSVGEGVQYQTAHFGSRDRLMVITGFGDRAGIWLVGQAEAQITLQPIWIGDPAESSNWIASADLDADGNDELVVGSQVHDPSGISDFARFRVLDWDGTQLVERGRLEPKGVGDPADFSPLLYIYAVDAGNTDGLPGDEIGWIGSTYSDAGESPRLYRLGMANGAPRLDSAPVGPGLQVLAHSPWPAIVVWDQASVWMADWPAGASGASLSEPTDTYGYIQQVGVIGQKSHPKLVVTSASLNTVAVLDPLLGTSESIDLTQSFPNSESWQPTTAGPVQGIAGDGSDGYTVGGQLITSTAEGTDWRPFPATFDGFNLGLVGPGGDLLAVSTPVTSGPASPGAYYGVSRVSIVALDDSSAFEVHDISATPPGAIPGADGVWLMGGEALAVTLQAPIGSRLLVGHTGPDFPFVPDQDLTTTARLTDLEIPPYVPPIDRYPSYVRVFVITPGGAMWRATWQLRPLLDPPKLEAATTGSTGSLDVTVSGQSEPWDKLLIDGRTVAPDARGSFSATVTVPPWPTSIRIESVDPFGQTTATVLTVVGLYDYRGLPWVPIVLVVTAVAGAFMWLRAPRHRRQAASDDGVFEEIQQ